MDVTKTAFLNENPKFKFLASNNKLLMEKMDKNGEVVSSGPVTLEQDGTFVFNVAGLNAETDTVTVFVEDEAGNSAEEVVFVGEAAPVVTLSVDPTELDLTTGDTAQLTVTETTTPEEGEATSDDVTAEATYAVADETVATVSVGGAVSAVAEGSTTVTVTYGNNEETVVVTVTEPVVPEPVVTLTVDKSNLNLTNGHTSQLTVTEVTTPEDGEATVKDVTKEALYTVADDKIVSVDKGLVRARAKGETTVTISYGGKTVTVNVTVTPPNPGGGGGGTNPPVPPGNPNHVTVDQNDVLNQANDKTTTFVKVELPALTDALPEASANLPFVSLNDVASSSKPLVLQSGLVQMVVPNKVLKDLVAGSPESTTISVKMAKSTGVNGAISSTFEFTITSVKDGITTTTTKFSEPVLLTVPVTAKVKDKRKVAAYYINEEAKSFEYVGGIYGKATFSFQTNHFSKFVVVESAKTFADVQNHWAKDQIEVLASRSMTAGLTDTTFNPEGKVTRAEFAVIIARALNLPVEEYKGTFKDVTTNKFWAYAGIEAAYEAGIVYGKTADTFVPDALITREEIATIIVRAVNYQDASLLKDVDTSKSFADDKSIGSFAKLPVKQAVGLGIVAGRSGNKFDPKANATRAEAAVMLYRALEKLNAF